VIQAVIQAGILNIVPLQSACLDPYYSRGTLVIAEFDFRTILEAALALK
jgi:hypothetical protein